MTNDTRRIILRHITAGDIYVADVDGETGHVYSAVGPLHHAEVLAVFRDEAPNWDADVAADLNLEPDRYVPVIDTIGFEA